MFTRYYNTLLMIAGILCILFSMFGRLHTLLGYGWGVFVIGFLQLITFWGYKNGKEN